MSKTLRSHAALPPRAVAEFFRLFAASGSVAFAADRTSLSRTVLYRRKRSDPAFAKRWAEAQELGVSKVRDEVFRRAVVGVKRPVFYGGAKIGKVRHFDNRLLWSLLKSHEPETYGPRRPHPMDPPDPIEAIKFRMEQQNLTRKDLEGILGTRTRVAEVLNRRRGLSINMIRRLHKELGIPAEVLIRSSRLKRAA